MSVCEIENEHLVTTCQEASRFLALDRGAKAESNWFKSIRNDRDARTFFSRNVVAKTTGFGVTVATLIAKAYLTCIEDGENELPPTGSQVQGIGACANALESELDAAGAWLIPEARSRAFREPLRMLGRSPSRLAPRTAGRRPLLRRRAFVLTLAESIYELTSTFPARLLMVSAVRGWEETGERQIRDILSNEEKRAIEIRVATRRKAIIESEDATRRLINQVSVAPRSENLVTDVRTDGQKVAEAMRLLLSLSDQTAATVLVEAIAGFADEFGIEAGQADQ